MSAKRKQKFCTRFYNCESRPISPSLWYYWAIKLKVLATSGEIMNKQQAAEFLGVSVRALERYVQQGRISVKYEKGKTRPTANFDQSELEAFKEELNQPTIKPAVESRQNSTDPQPQSDKPVLYAGEIAEFGDITVVDKLSSIIETLLAKDEQQPTVPIADKLLLTLPEVQALTGLPKDFLRDAINQGSLKAVRIGRSWRVKRKDLEEFVAGLF
jgi:excisionase family DNA binding protein